MNEESSFDLEEISGMIRVRHTSFLSGMGPALVFKFEPNVVVKIYNNDKNMEWDVQVFKKKVVIQRCFVRWDEMRNYVEEYLNRLIQELVDDSCLGEWEDGFST